MELRALSVTELNNYLSRHISLDPILSNVKIAGEISDFKLSSLGHAYFRISDCDSSVSCVIFKGDYCNIEYDFSDGEYVELLGQVKVYTKRGQYQIQVKEMRLKGEGQSKIEFEKLKKKLDKEGLFSLAHKKPLPKFPKKIGVVTSPNGAALQDVINVLTRRAPYLEIMVFPAVVQGQYAPDNIVRNLEMARVNLDIDALILTRGGGSGEDLSAFNDEQVVRTLFSMPYPVISAIGHEIDFSLCDYVADMRAPTPSAAAELIAPDINELISELTSKINRIYNRVNDNLIQKRAVLESFLPDKTMIRIIDKLESKLDICGAKLHAVSPLSTLNRGYTLVEDTQANIIGFEDINTDDTINIIFDKGKVICHVEEKISKDNNI